MGWPENHRTENSNTPRGYSVKGFFITGTDTDVGKTLVATAILRQMVAQGKRVVAMKPVAAGAVQTTAGLLNEDVAQLRAAANVDVPLALMNPYVYAEPIAPHLAAARQADEIDLACIDAAYKNLCARAERIVVEGAGGFCVPLNARETMADLAQLLALPLVLVVGMRLGCLNHALLTVEAIQARGLHIAGWVANSLRAPMPLLDENITALRVRIPAPLWGIVPPLDFSPTQIETQNRSNFWSPSPPFPIQ